MSDTKDTERVENTNIDNKDITNTVKSDDDEGCVICLGDDTDNLIENFFCECKFRYHMKCYRDWILKSRSKVCIICEKELDKDIIDDFVGSYISQSKSSPELEIITQNNDYSYNNYAIIDSDSQDSNEIYLENRYMIKRVLNFLCQIIVFIMFLGLVIIIVFNIS
jgi:hypothetical protein